MFDGYVKARALLRREVPGLSGVFVFGSEASGRAQTASDIDLAFLARTPFPKSRIAVLANEIASLLGRDVDLVDLRSAPTVLQMQILSEGVAIDRSDSFSLDLFEVETMREYSDLKYRRRELEADVVARGRVYG